MIPRPARFTLRAAALLLALGFLLETRAGDEPRVLVYQRNGKGFVHDNLRACADALAVGTKDRRRSLRTWVWS